MNSDLLIGMHHRSDGAIEEAILQAHEFGSNCAQIFLSDADAHEPCVFSAAKISQINELIQKCGIKKLFVHATFRVSLTAKNARLLAMSRRSIYKELEICEAIGADGLVIHPGSAKEHSKSATDPFGIQAGLETLVEQVEKITQKPYKTKLLLENTAYGKSTVGGNLNEFAFLRKNLSHNPKVGFCFDTAHAFAYGYPMKPFDNFVHSLEEAMSKEMLNLVHLNDSAVRLNSRLDKHEAPGNGLLGVDVLKNLAIYCHKNSIPMIVELPASGMVNQAALISMIKQWVSQL